MNGKVEHQILNMVLTKVRLLLADCLIHVGHIRCKAIEVANEPRYRDGLGC